jgi:hypothetical protein
MFRNRSLPCLTTRLMRWCALGVFAVTALLGSAGLHAIAPHTCCGEVCAVGEDSHSHAGHTHSHSHAGCGHSHSKPAEKPDSAPTPGPCDDDCVICKHMSAPVVTPAPVLMECSERVVTAVEPRDAKSPLCGAPLVTAIRGPPSVV